MSAYRSQEYIIEAIDSLNNQALPADWEMKMYIGVDNCSSTAKVLEDNNISYYWAKENVGTYIMANSLIKEAAGSDMFLRFDSDDVALENFLFHGIENGLKYNICRAYKRDVGGALEKITDRRIIQNGITISNTFNQAFGVCFYTPVVLEKIGGYEPHRASCDSFFIRRARESGFNIPKKVSNEPRFLRRVHPSSLTSNKSTKQGSKLRNDAHEAMQKNIRQKKLKIDPVTTALEYRKK